MTSTFVDWYQYGADGLKGFLNFQLLLDSLSKILDDYRPATYLVAFILLVVSTMHGFLQPDTRRFFQTLVHSIVLVALICQAPTIIQWFEDAAKGFAALPQARQIKVGNQTVDFKPGETPLIKDIQEVLVSKAQPQDSKNQGQRAFDPLDMKTWFSWVSLGRAFAWQLLFGLYLLVLLLSKMIILLMIFIQQVIVIGFKLYAPIGIAEYSLRTLKGKATSFFLTFIGVLCWPIGWSIVNSVTLAIFRIIPAPTDNDLPSIIWSNVMVLPVLIWVFVGHVMAPVFVQKVVIHGGGVMQGFVGSTFSIIGIATATAYGAPLQAAARLLGRGRNGGETTAVQENGTSQGSSRAERGGRSPIFEAERRIGNGWNRASNRETFSPRAGQSLGRILAKPLNFGAGAIARVGAVAGFVGHAVTRGSGSGTGLEGEALAAVAPPGTYRRLAARPLSWPNQSSMRARKYIDQR